MPERASQRLKDATFWAYGVWQLPVARHELTMLFQPCLALSAPIQHPLNYLVLRVLKLTLCMVHIRLAIANRPKDDPRGPGNSLDVSVTFLSATFPSFTFRLRFRCAGVCPTETIQKLPPAFPTPTEAMHAPIWHARCQGGQEEVGTTIS